MGKAGTVVATWSAGVTLVLLLYNVSFTSTCSTDDGGRVSSGYDSLAHQTTISTQS